MLRSASILFFAILLLPLAAHAGPLKGQATVIDGDTLDIHGDRVRMLGIDAPESSQLCQDDAGSMWRCGQQAAFALANKIDRAVVTCAGGERDRYGRLLAVCSVGKTDLSAWMVRGGWAMAYVKYSESYAKQEHKARADKAGIWAGQFVPPWDWRRGTRLLVAKGGAQTPECQIKGNISRKSGERIYHLPGGRSYAKTKISPVKGERWFCSEDEAKAAGWRAAKGG